MKLEKVFAEGVKEQGQEARKSLHEFVSCMVELVGDEAGSMLQGREMVPH